MDVTTYEDGECAFNDFIDDNIVPINVQGMYVLTSCGDARSAPYEAEGIVFALYADSTHIGEVYDYTDQVRFVLASGKDQFVWDTSDEWSWSSFMTAAIELWLQA